MIILIAEAVIVMATAWMFTKKYFNTRLNSELILVWFILFFSQIVLVGLFWGIIGKLYWGNIFLTQLVIFILAFLFCYNKNTFRFSKPDLDFFINSNLLIFAFTVFLAFFLVKIYVNLINPPLSPDSMAQHLVFPAAWIKNGNLDSPFQIFGSTPILNPGGFEPSAGSYYPVNAQLFFTWLMLPLNNAFLADVGEAPFYIIGIVAIYSILGKYGVNKKIALLSGLLWVLIPNIFKQLRTASQIDVICAVLFLLVFYTLLLLRHKFNFRSAMLFGISVGLFIGTKVINLVWLIGFLPMICYMAYKGMKEAKLSLSNKLGLTGIIALMIVIFGGFIYIKNYYFTGNPLFPVNLSILGKNVFKGLLSNSAYKMQIALSDRFDILRFIFKEGLSGQFPALILPGFFIPLFSLVFFKKKFIPTLEYILLFASPLIMFIVYNHFINIYLVRYIFPLLSFGLITAIIFLTRIPYGEKYIVFVGFISVLASAFALANGYELIVGLLFFLVLFVNLLIYKIKIIEFYRGKMFGRAVLAIGLLMVVFLVYLDEKYDREEFERYPASFSRRESWQSDTGKGWKALNELTGSGARVAYTGRQEFYPLYGSKLKNFVKYVSVNEKEITPYNKPDGLYRKTKNFSAWKENLKKDRIDFLFISLPFAVNNESNDPRKFPIEDEWANAHPENFQLLFSNTLSRIYKINKDSGYFSEHD